MDSWNRFNETKLPDKKEFYNNLNQEVITNKDHKHAKKSMGYIQHKANTMIYMFKQTRNSLQAYLNSSEKHV